MSQEFENKNMESILSSDNKAGKNTWFELTVP